MNLKYFLISVFSALFIVTILLLIILRLIDDYYSKQDAKNQSKDIPSKPNDIDRIITCPHCQKTFFIRKGDRLYLRNEDGLQTLYFNCHFCYQEIEIYDYEIPSSLTSS